MDFRPANQGMTRGEAIRFLIQRGELPTPEKINDLTGAVTEFKPAGEIKAELKVEKPKTEDFEPKVKIIKNANYDPKAIEPKDFATYFRNRYAILKQFLISRLDCSDATSINKLSVCQGREKQTLVAYVLELQKLPTGTFKLILEDPSGTINAIISAKKPELLKKAQMLITDEVVAFKGSGSGKLFFVEDIIWPDIPQVQKKCSPDEVYMVVSGDVHVGSDTFMKDKFEKFIVWLRGESEDEELKELAVKTKYVIFPGDVVDGIGVYPSQDKELVVKDIHKQFEIFTDYIKQIPRDKQIIIIPGNHEPMRLEEPQPAIQKEYARDLYEMPNVHMLTNPCMVNIHAVGDFSGFKLLLYHGASFGYFFDNIEELRLAGGYKRPDLIMNYLLQRRHLAPAYGSVSALPTKEDHLIISTIPDMFITGHIHKPYVSKYKGILTLAASCWQSNTSYQEHRGIEAEPCKVQVLNLKNGKVKVLDFS